MPASAPQTLDAPAFDTLFHGRLDPKAYDDRFVLHGGGVFVVCHLANALAPSVPDAYLAVFVQESAVPDQAVHTVRDGPHGTGFYPATVGGALFNALNVNVDYCLDRGLPGCRQTAVATDAEALKVRAAYEASGFEADAVRVALMPWFTAATTGRER